MSNGHQDPRRPFVDPKLAKHQAFLDSLLGAAGVAPDSIVRRPLGKFDRLGYVTEGYFDPRTRTVTISPFARSPERTAAHELGHVQMAEDPETFYEYAREVLGQEPAGVRQRDGSFRIVDRQAEPFANDFRDAMFARLGRSVPDSNSDTQLLLNLLAAASKRQKTGLPPPGVSILSLLDRAKSGASP